MNVDPHNWSPLSVEEVADVFRPIPVQWWIAGGWALDLFLGRTTREHGDIDVLVLQPDQLVVQQHLRDDWELFKTHQPTPSHLAPWPPGELLEPPIEDIWARRPGSSAWSFQIMLLQVDVDQWVYKRLASIRGRIASLGLLTRTGIPYLRPEIQLLYKGGGPSADHERNLRDLRNVLPKLPLRRAEWLLRSLRAQYPQGHEWIALIGAELRARRA